jgi:hypothetical protein
MRKQILLQWDLQKQVTEMSGLRWHIIGWIGCSNIRNAEYFGCNPRNLVVG